MYVKLKKNIYYLDLQTWLWREEFRKQSVWWKLTKSLKVSKEAKIADYTFKILNTALKGSYYALLQSLDFVLGVY